MENTITKFETGKTYETRSACDHNCIFSFTVIKRTAKFITIESKHREVKRVGVYNYDGAESAMPLGSYSMAPVIRADREVA